MELKRPVITGAAFAALAFNGMTFAFVGTSLPALRSYMGINIELAGSLMATFQAGFTLFTLVGGLLSDLVRREKVLLLGCILLSLSTFQIGIWVAFGANLAVFFCMGTGVGLILSGSNALLVGLYPQGKGLILNVHHVFFGIGSLIGPVLMGWLLIYQRWATGYTGLAIVIAVLGSIFYRVNTEARISTQGKDFGRQVGQLLVQRHYLVLVVVSAMAVGTQLALTLLTVLFLTEAKAIPIGTASVVLSAFFVCMVVGRLVCGRLSGQLGLARITLFLLSLQFLTLVVVWYAAGWVAIVFAAMSGLACSAIYPSLLALTSLLFKAVEGSALGILSTMAGLGSILICWLNGVLAQQTSVGFGFVILVSASLVALLVFAFNYPGIHRQEVLAGGVAQST